MSKPTPVPNDDYHLRYPDCDNDYTQRLMWFALFLTRAKEAGIRNVLVGCKEQWEAVGMLREWTDEVIV